MMVLMKFTHIINRHLNITEFKKKKKIQQVFLLIYYILLLKGLHTCATRNIYVFKISFYHLRVQYQCIEINED